MTEPFLPISMTRQAIIDFTPEWTGDRMPDGRPKTADSILDRIRMVTVTEAWMAMHNREYRAQYAGGWSRVNPDKVLVGRALTAMYMPKRPSLHETIVKKATAAGQVGDQVSWPIDALSPGDVYVADVMGRIAGGPVIGDNLATAIMRKSGNGVVQNAAVRDVEGIMEVEGFTAFTRGVHPSYASLTVSLMGINCPVRIDEALVFPGDVVLGKVDGVIFVPPHLAETVCVYSEIVRVRDIFGKLRLNQGKYLPGEIDRKWEEHIEKDFLGWLAQGHADLPVPKATIQEFLKGRSW
jgi:4-hydroxy-4-methyl-2-oxoglutarate aldolase